MPDVSMDAYQHAAARTGRAHDGMSWNEHRMLLALGLAGEGGEIADLLKKEVGHGHDPKATAEALMGELGDVLWYVSEMARAYGWSLSDVAAFNVDKLWKRYPLGFSEEASRNRGA